MTSKGAEREVRPTAGVYPEAGPYEQGLLDVGDANFVYCGLSHSWARSMRR